MCLNPGLKRDDCTCQTDYNQNTPGRQNQNYIECRRKVHDSTKKFHQNVTRVRETIQTAGLYSSLIPAGRNWVRDMRLFTGTEVNRLFALGEWGNTGIEDSSEGREGSFDKARARCLACRRDRALIHNSVFS